jgi:urease subunit gamma/beta
VETARHVLTVDDVLPGVAHVVSQVQVEAVFADGTRLAVVDNPIAGSDPTHNTPGIVVPAQRSAVQYTDVITLKIANTAAVPISITSHFHFFEVNKLLRFDRAAAYGRRLATTAGAVTRFDPGTAQVVALTPIRGTRTAIGFAGLVDGPLDAPGAKAAALRRAHADGYLDTGDAVETAP